MCGGDFRAHDVKSAEAVRGREAHQQTVMFVSRDLVADDLHCRFGHGGPDSLAKLHESCPSIFRNPRQVFVYVVRFDACRLTSFLVTLFLAHMLLPSCRLLIQAEYVSSRITEPGGYLRGIHTDRLHDATSVGFDRLNGCGNSV